jgi:beta-lactamase regulating signal transducer with metallopeptidase domain
MMDAIAWALVHFLWQGAALALLSLILTRLASSASVRYTIGVATMAAMVIAVGVTIATGPDTAAVGASTELAGSGVVEGGTTVQRSAEVAHTPEADGAGVFARRTAGAGGLPTTWILAVWMLGVVALSARAAGGWWVARRVAHSAVSPVSEDLQRTARMLAGRMGITRAVGVFESSRVLVPVMIGWLRPVVLMPPAALAGLSPAQIEAIFAHEFAHIRRHDYLVNLLQTAVETVLFFHPAVWWVSREIRRERELCCDDVAVRVCDRVTYATALSALAHLQPPSLSLAATDGSLRDRVRRIISDSPSSDSAKGGWMAMLPLLLVLSLAAPSAFSQSAVAQPKAAPVTTEKPTPPEPKTAPMVFTAEGGVVHMKAGGINGQAKRIEVKPESVALVGGATMNTEAAQLLDEQLVLERRRLELERARLRNAAALEIQSLEIQLERARSSQAFVQNKLDAEKKAGEVQPRTASELQQTIHNAQTQLKKLETATESLRLSLEELDIREQELVLQRKMKKVGLPSTQERLIERSPVLRRLSQDEAVMPGDALTIIIDGTSTGPTDFAVDAAGSIRHPQLGAIAVAEHTTDGVRQKVIKLLVAKGLLADPTVTVSAVRR